MIIGIHIALYEVDILMLCGEFRLNVFGVGNSVGNGAKVLGNVF